MFSRPKEGATSITVSNIIGRSPGILNHRGSTGVTKTVFAERSVAPEGEVSDQDNLHKSQEQVSRKRVLDNIFGHFPIFQDLAIMCCSCRSCHSHSQTPSVSILRGNGCVRTTAFQETLTLIAHGIADGFGVDDVSAASDTTPVTEAMICLLLQELCEDNRIIWDTWLSVAACVFLGCPFQRHVLDVKDGGTTYAAIQYGNLAVVAPWVDLSQQLMVEGCFRLTPAKGRVGITTYDSEDREQFRSVEEEFAIIQTGATGDTRSLSREYPKESILPRAEITLDDDHTIPDVDFILVSVAESVYRLLMRVQTQNYSRIIDSSGTIKRITRTLPLHPRCPHTKTCTLPKLALLASVYSFDDVVGLWCKWDDEGAYEVSNEEEKPATYHITERLTSQLQQNIALTLSVDTITAVDNGMCFDCILKVVERVENPPDRADRLHDRFLVIGGAVGDKALAVRREI